jgi:predicted house-cleaning noncanonical NTP pyrophosphatase (MazG superfamily)
MSSLASSEEPRNKGVARQRGKQLHPIRSLQVVYEDGPRELIATEITPDRVGWKAFGLSALPLVWAPPLFVIDADSVTAAGVLSEPMISRYLNVAGIAVDAQLLIRSSGTAETLRQRGQLYSEQCNRARIAETLRVLIDRTAGSASGKIHWIVQEYHRPRASGHFSNERRMSYEKRDWVMETEPRNGHPNVFSPVAVRRWRDGLAHATGSLGCSSEARISLCLKQVAMWAHQFSHRVHFEWIWDRKEVFLVQADPEDASEGIRPEDTLPKVIPDVKIHALKAFRLATAADFSAFKKLKNARLYGDLGYSMPAFYVMTDSTLISRILKGGIPEEIKDDLETLTERPLIVRTDGLGLPSDQREMLPRSDELRSADEAAAWLTGCFRNKIIAGGLQEASLALIAHHFIPSLASAWAQSEPGRTIVRVESLWGIPEGLYWFSHDTFEVDTQVAMVSPESGYSGVIFPYSKKLRYKGTLVAPDPTGKWISGKIAAPFDWSPSVGGDAWLSEIAWRTRQIAEHEKEAVSVMWFVGNHVDATKHPVLPWFHDKFELGDTPKAAPRRKFRKLSDFRIETSQDWEDLKARIGDGKPIERVVVEPTDPSLIRDPQFAKALAELSKSQNFVVELSGGILSHVYYILQRSGARVECVDLFGDEEDIVEFYKVVRDKIPAGIVKKGEHAYTVRLAGDALVLALKQKLVEEAFEALDATSGEELISELADVLEVLRGLSKVLEVDFDRIESDRKAKKKRRGGFEDGYMLTKTATPHSLLQPFRDAAQNAQDIRMNASEPSALSDPLHLPARPPYRRPDLRQSDDLDLEKMLTVETDVNRLRELKETLNFSFPGSNSGSQQFSLVLELKRIRVGLRAVVRLRRVATQMRLAFDDRQLLLFDEGEGPT